MDTHAPRSGGNGASRVHELLSHAPLFRGLAPEDLARIAAGTREVRAARGEAIFHRGDPCEGFHVVAVGRVKLALVNPAGDEKVVEIVGPGMSFGEALMFAGRPYIVDAIALADSLLLHVNKATLFAEIDREPALARRMLASLSVRTHMLMKDLEAVSLHSATQRVIGYLARLDEETGSHRVTLPAQKALVASRLNLTPEYFSRILHDMAARGLVRIDARDIEILDPEGLRALGAASDA
ncbi:MAG TPA: Crp/Fnr family transcriptional regulator [Usitatibacter sp.]|nr:Crp/Fnr family transcriptional regulator [Usitatibacter sp.]